MRDASATADGHSSVVFSSDAEWAERLVAFVRAGLRRDEQVQYFADVTAPDLVMRTSPGTASTPSPPCGAVSSR